MRLIIDENHQPDGSMHGRISFCFDKEISINEGMSADLWFESFRELSQILVEIGNRGALSSIGHITAYCKDIAKGKI